MLTTYLLVFKQKLFNKTLKAQFEELAKQHLSDDVYTLMLEDKKNSLLEVGFKIPTDEAESFLNQYANYFSWEYSPRYTCFSAESIARIQYFIQNPHLIPNGE